MNQHSPFIEIDLTSPKLLANRSMAYKSQPFDEWCLEKDLSKDSIQKLVNERFTLINLLAMAEQVDILDMKLKPRTQHRAVLS